MEKILLIEDDPRMLRSLEKLLAAKGFEVIAAANGMEAIEKSQENEFALVITDVRMPGIDGIETLGRLGPYQPQARKVIITGFAGDDAPIRAIQVSADDYLMKPFGSEIFLRSVQNALSRYQFEKQKAGIIQGSSQLVSGLLRSVISQVDKRMWGRENFRNKIMDLCEKLGSVMDLSTIQMERLRKAAFCHDLGFISLPRENLPDSGFDLHALEAVEVLRLTPEYQEIVPILLSHHKSHEEGGEEIPLEAKILRLCENYEILVSEKQLSQKEAISTLENERPGYDAVCLSSLSSIVLSSQVQEGDRFPKGTSQQGSAAKKIPGESDSRKLEKLLNLARVYTLIGETGTAKAILLEIQGHEEIMKDEEFRFKYFLFSSQNLIRDRKFMEGYEQAEKALEIALSRHLGSPAVAKVFLEMSLAKLFLSSFEQVSEMLQKADEIFGKFEDWQNKARANLYLALCAIGEHDEKKAKVFLENCGRLMQGDQFEEWVLGEGFALSHPSGKEIFQFFSPLLQGQKSTEEIRIYSLGPFRVYRGSNLIKEEEWKSKKAKVLLAFLLFNMDKPVPEEHFCDVFWPDLDFERSRKNLHNTIYLLRRTLEPSLEDGSQSKYVLSLRNAYQFNQSASYWWDVADLKKQRQEAEQFLASGDVEKGISCLGQVEGLYMGEILEDYLEEIWCDPEREKTREIYLKSLLDLASLAEKEGKHGLALERISKVLSQNPLHEEAATKQISILARSGQRSEAIRRYHEWSDLLKRELNLGPPPELVSVYLEMTSKPL